MRYYLGVDGGGTKTAASIIDAEGVEHGRGVGGSGHIALNDDTTLARSLQDAVQNACAAANLSLSATRFQGVCAGVAGYSIGYRRNAFLDLLRNVIAADTYRIEPDYNIAYWGASHGEPGIVVIAGTGAVTYGRNAAGAADKEDGLGYLLGDRGSGFDLGRTVLQHALEQLQRKPLRKKPLQGQSLQEDRCDALTEAILHHIGARTPSEVLQWIYHDFHAARVASLAPIVGALAEGGDPAARKHVAQMARRLRYAVRQIRLRLRLPHDVPVYPLGGVWNLGAFFREEFAEPHHAQTLRASERSPRPEKRLHVVAPKSDAAHGAALLAKETEH